MFRWCDELELFHRNLNAWFVVRTRASRRAGSVDVGHRIPLIEYLDAKDPLLPLNKQDSGQDVGKLASVDELLKRPNEGRILVLGVVAVSGFDKADRPTPADKHAVHRVGFGTERGIKAVLGGDSFDDPAFGAPVLLCLVQNQLVLFVVLACVRLMVCGAYFLRARDTAP